ncbi:MAG: Crp/Fnr family transcriptional regulator [Gammaproteobacteria bacterium]|nr:Crp/Fnr family transcriptional regulator [Gammaproteobacteria bacterium]
MHETFSEHWLIRDIDSASKLAFFDLGELVTVAPDDVVIEANVPNQSIYLLLEGAFKVFLPDRRGQGAGRTLGHRGPGDLIGEYSFIDDMQPTVTVSASTAGLMLRFDHGLLREYLDHDPSLGGLVYRNMLRYLVDRLRAQDEELSCLMI